MERISENQRLILKLLSKALFNKHIELPEKIDWNGICKESITQTVFPLIYKVLGEVMPPEEKTKWQRLIYQMLANNVQVLYEHKQVHEIFTREKVPYVIIKGACSAKYYPEPKLRMMGDVDFVVKEKDLTRAGDVLKKEGFIWTEDKEHPAHHVYHKGRSTWEMHWTMSGIPTGENGKSTRKLFDEIIETSVYDSDGYNIPDEFHHGLVMLIHTARHLVNTGIGVRHLCDWAVFAEKFDNNDFKDTFEEKLKECGLWRFAQLLTQLSIKYLGMSEKAWAMEDVDEEYLDSMMSDIFAGGNFGRKDPERINQAKLFTNQRTGTVGDNGFIRQGVASLNERALRAMPIAKRVPVLLPLSWLYVGIRHLRRIRRGLRPSIHIDKIVEGANERRNIYKEFLLFEERVNSASNSGNNKSSAYDLLKKYGMPIYKCIKKTPLRRPLYYFQDACFVIRYWLYGPPRVSKTDIKNVEHNVTFLYKSFERQKQAKRLYKCLRKYYPKAKIVIADDSSVPLVINKKDQNLTILHLPFNSGLSKGLDEGLKKVTTDYVMRMDDDELLTPKSKVHDQLKYLQKNTEVDLVGLQLTHLDIKRLIERYRRIRMNKELKIPAGTVIDGKEVIYKSANVYLVRTESLRKVGYDPNIRMIDHHEFFYRAAGNIVTVMAPEAYVLHCHNWFESRDYEGYRSAYREDAQYIASKHGIQRV